MSLDLSAGMDRLPSGRHRLPRETVFASQRGRILIAMIRVVGERGWDNTRITDVVAHAGVSRQTFYQHFENKDACFVEAFRVGMPAVFEPIDADAAELADADLRGRVRAFWEAYVQALVDEPGLARALHIETLRASDDVLAMRANLYAMLADRIRRVYERRRRQDPNMPELPGELFYLIIGGLDETIRERLRTLGPKALDGLAPLATQLTLAALGDTGYTP